MFANTVRALSPEARVLATLNGEAAIVSSRFGRGETLFVGSFVGAATHQSTPTVDATSTETVNTGGPSTGAFRMPEVNTAFIRGLADWAGIERPVTTTLDGLTNPPLIARLHDAGDGYLLFLVNYNSEAQDVGVEVAVDENGSYALRELITGERETSAAEGNRLPMRTHLEGKGVQVWSLTRVR
jgi:hypothetical protein